MAAPKHSRHREIDPPKRARAPLVAMVFVSIAAVHILAMRFVCDDAYISYRYARNLVAGHGLVYNPGERVEGYSNFLWTLISALVIRVGGAPDVWMPIVSALCALGTVAVIVATSVRLGGRGWGAGLLLAVSSAWAAWATGGLETALFTLLVTAGVASLALSWPLLGAAAFGLASLTRPEGLLVAACAGCWLAARAMRGHLDWRSVGLWTAIVALIVAPHLLWRREYYGEWLPHSFGVKTPGAHRLFSGFADLGRAVVELHLYLPLAAIAAAAWGTRRRLGSAGAPLGPIAVAGIPFVAYVGATGGDFMPLFRFLVPALPLLAWAAGAALETLAGGEGRNRVGRWLAVGLALAYVGLEARGSWRQQDAWAAHDVESIQAVRNDTRNWRRVGNILRALADPSDTLATSAAGVIPYTTGLYTVDLLGLNVRDLSWFRKRGVDRPGHSLVLTESRLVTLRPQFLLGHPFVFDQPKYVGPNLELDPAWRERVLSGYEMVGITLPGGPAAYVGCGIRKDVAPRVQARSLAMPQDRTPAR